MPPSTVTRPAAGVERQHAIESPCVDEHRALAELLAAHRVPAAGDRHRRSGGPRSKDGGAELVHVARRDDGRDAGGVELRVQVVDEA